MTNEVEPGAVLLFYRSHDRPSIEAVGVAEGSLRSHKPIDIIHYVGTRTVYSEAEVEAMAEEASRGVLAILFRQAASINNTPLADLVGAGVLKGSPQSITQVQSTEGIEWIRSQIEA